ncbi:unnamed protein product [Acanthosepion pharaonis]|uniref:Uncharacterized protein n=1 Tax=Acanthosepion pharaonis TaxID=158019 RepID=A0A812CBR1_ACAPH|nr:unnamed protein product [Sepia pharaonis]
MDFIFLSFFSSKTYSFYGLLYTFLLLLSIILLILPYFSFYSSVLHLNHSIYFPSSALHPTLSKTVIFFFISVIHSTISMNFVYFSSFALHPPLSIVYFLSSSSSSSSSSSAYFFDILLFAVSSPFLHPHISSFFFPPSLLLYFLHSPFSLDVSFLFLFSTSFYLDILTFPFLPLFYILLF